MFFFETIFIVKFSLNGDDQFYINVAIAITALLLTVRYGIPAIQSRVLERDKEKIKRQELFKKDGWINTSELSYDDLDYNRKMHANLDLSYQKNAREEIINVIAERKEKEYNNHILLVGPSLSGKTHLTISILRDLDNAYVLLPNEATFYSAAADGFDFPIIPNDAQYKIVLLDDFHEFFKSGEVNPKSLIHKAIKNGFTLWGNCISIDEYDRVISILNYKENILGLFKKVELTDKLTSQELNNLRANDKQKRQLSTFNGLIGEYYYPPGDMLQHYNDIKSNSIARDVLILIKQAYMLGELNIPYIMKINSIKIAFSKKYELNSDFSSFYTALKFIERKGFIRLTNNHETFNFDSVWLNEIVEPNMKRDDFYKFWKDILPKNVVLYSYIIHNSENYNNAIAIYEEMLKEGITPTDLTFNILINHSPDYSTALKWYQNIENADVYTYTTMIKHTQDYETALEWYRRIDPGEASVFTYTSLMNISPDYSTALNWFEKIDPNEVTGVTFNCLIKLSPNYEIAVGWYNKMDPNEVSVVTYNTLIECSPDYRRAMEWYEKIDPNETGVITYNTLIERSPDYDTALKWYEKINENDRCAITYNILMKVSSNYNIALEWFEKIAPNEATNYTYNTLMKYSPDYNTALRWFKRIPPNQINAYSYNVLMNASPDYNTSLQWFEKIDPEQVSQHSYSCLIKRSPDYDTALKWFKKIDQFEVSPQTYNALINISPNYATALEWLGKMNSSTHNSYIYNTLIRISPNYSIALEWFEKIEPEQRTVYTYHCLLRKSSSIAIINEVIKRMKSNNIALDSQTYSAIFKAIYNFTEVTNTTKYQYAISFHDDMLENKIKSNIALFTMLIVLAPDFDTAYDLLKSMPKHKGENGMVILPNQRTKNAIIKKALGQRDLIDKLYKWFRENT